eukprot:jgi/Chrzof1/2757/Cz11g28050.t1
MDGQIQHCQDVLFPFQACRTALLVIFHISTTCKSSLHGVKCASPDSWSILQHFAHVFMAVFAGTCRFRKYFLVRLTNYILTDFGAAKTSANACHPYQSSH